MDYRKRITINPAIRSGKPCIINTRIVVNDILDYFRYTHGTFLGD